MTNSSGPTTLYVNGENMLQKSSILDGKVSYDKDTNTLTLNNATLDKSGKDVENSTPELTYGAVIYATGGDLTIKLEGENTITYGDSNESNHTNGLLFYDINLTIEGTDKRTDKLTIRNNATGNTEAIYCDINGGKDYFKAQKENNLTIKDATVQCKGNSNTLNASYVYGVYTANGILTMDNGDLFVTTGNSNARYDTYGMSLNVINKQHCLKGNSEVNVVAGTYSSEKSIGIAPGKEASIKMDAGAKLYSSGQNQAIFVISNLTVEANSAELTAKGSADYENKNPTDEIATKQSKIEFKTVPTGYKTIEVIAKRSGTVTGVEIAKETEPVTVKKGATYQFAANVAVGEGEPDTTVAWSISGANSNKTTISADGLLTVGDDETAESITVTATSNHDNSKSDSITVNISPAFTDGFGNMIDPDNFSDYNGNEETAKKGYIFDGWYDSEGNKITAENPAKNGVTYTAKWKNSNDKFVRIAALDLTSISTVDNTAEGWSWDSDSKTLTLNGCTIDVLGDQAAIILPAGAVINTVKDTNNIALSEQADGISGAGALTIAGAGDLYVTGKERGIYAIGQLIIKAPLVAKATDANGKAVLAKTITKENCWSIKAPGRGKIVSDGANAYIGNGKVSNEVTIGAAELYTVTYNTDGGSDVDVVSAYENTSLTKPADPTKNGYNFIGWYKDEGLQTLWDFDYDIVTSDVTLYAKWTKEPVHAISGIVKKDNGTGSESLVEGAKVILKQGTEEISIATTDENGEYTFDNVPSGEYNIVIERTEGDNTVTKTALITVSDPEEGQSSGTIADVVLPNKAVSSVVELENGTPAVLVGGLDDEAISRAEDDNNVTVKLKVVAQTQTTVPAEADEAIKQLAGGKTLEYLDMTVVKSITTAGTTGVPQSINNTNNVLEIVVPFQTNGKNSITVYRHHEVTGTDAETNAFQKLEQRPTADYEDGTYFVGDGFLVIYTKKFSTYAIGYNTYSGGSTAAQKPEVTVNGEGRTELSKDGKTMTIIPNEGYEIKSVLVNGKDMGKTNKLTGLKTGDKVVVIFSKIAQEPVDMDSQICQQLSKAQLKARSSFTANRNVKVVFETDKQTKTLLEDIQKAGYTVKYKYTRSTKKSAKKYAASYKQMLTKFTKTYLNTYGKKSTMYYYRVSIMVYDKDGKFVAKTDINQCRYANRLWSK